MKIRFNEYGLHAIILVVLIVIPLMIQLESTTINARFMFHFWLMIFGLIITFYSNYLYGIDHLFYKKKYIKFIIFNIIIIFFNDTVETIARTIIEDEPRVERIRSAMMQTMYIYHRIIFATLGIGAALAVSYSRKLIDSEKKREVLETEKLTSEISLLKYQIQPHFFFNILNSIYSLISKSPNDAQKAVHSLSKMMRYILYENTSDLININKEIDFIKNYHNLMLLRINKNVKIHFDLPTEIDNINIPPLLLIPLVENAYKHGIIPTKDSFITASLKTDNNNLIFRVENSINTENTEDHSNSGIGLQNLRKRLSIIYADEATFTTQKSENNTFVAQLIIPIRQTDTLNK